MNPTTGTKSCLKKYLSKWGYSFVCELTARYNEGNTTVMSDGGESCFPNRKA